MLTEQAILDNRKTFLDLVNSIQVEGANIEGLVDFLEKSDFFTAPASTIYHCGYKGGLCEHCLNVYDSLVKLTDTYTPDKYDINSIKIVALFHDISKVNFYEVSTHNKKVYSENGSKSDNLGKYDWFSEESYKVKDVQERYVGADHGTNSYLILSRYIPLMEEEIIAIINHHCGFDNNFVNKDLSAILNRYPLATLLHTADFISTYIKERI